LATLREDEQPSKVALQWNPKGNRGRGRPRKRWRRSTLRKDGKNWSELRHLAMDRKKIQKACRRLMLLMELQIILLLPKS
jgi:hypothetical protein